jgi:hypothetical protein
MKWYIYAILAIFVLFVTAWCKGGSGSSVTYKSLCEDGCNAQEECAQSGDDDDDNDSSDFDMDQCVEDCVDAYEEQDPDGECVSELKKLYDCGEEFGCMETYEDIQDYLDTCADEIDDYNQCVADLAGDDDDDNDDNDNDDNDDTD